MKKPFIFSVQKDDHEYSKLVQAKDLTEALKLVFASELGIRTSIYPKEKKLNALSFIRKQTKRTE